MKQSILAVLFALTAFACFAAEKNEPLYSKEIKTTGFTEMAVSADVTVVLVNDDSKTVRIEGDEMLMKSVTVTQKGGRLVIRANTRRNMKKNGVIYVPARLLHFMEINSDALVQSLNTLPPHAMDVVINGNCRLVLATLGEVNLIGTALFDVEYDIRQSRPIAASVNVRKE